MLHRPARHVCPIQVSAPISFKNSASLWQCIALVILRLDVNDRLPFLPVVVMEAWQGRPAMNILTLSRPWAEMKPPFSRGSRLPEFLIYSHYHNQQGVNVTRLVISTTAALF